MGYKLTENMINDRLDNGVKIKYETFQGVDYTATFIDPDYGEWSARPVNVFKGGMHPKRRSVVVSKAKALSIEEVKRRLPDHITIIESTYVNTRTKAKFIDKDYGEFETVVDNVTRKGRGAGFNHPERARSNLVKKRTLSPDTISSRLVEYNPKVKMIESTYCGVDKKAKFIDEDYGEFEARPGAVLRGGRHPAGRYKRIKETMIERYGVEHNSHIPEVASRMAKSASNVYIEYHWENGGELTCQGKLELAVVQYFNKHKIPFAWQITFKMPSGKTYRVDAYLPNENMYIEIKGYFRTPVSKEKWEWFHWEYPNSELWTESVLRDKGIITEKRNKFWKIS